MILVDSSVWIDYFRGGKTGDTVDLLLDHNLACISGIILSEIVPALKVRGENRLIKLLGKLDFVDTPIDWQKVIDHRTMLLKKGVNGIGLPDIMLVQLAQVNDLSLFSLDKHFKKMHKYLDFNLFL